MQVYKNKSLILTSAVMLIVGFILGFLASSLNPQTKLLPQTPTQSQDSFIKDNFDSITASIKGKIISFNGGTMVIENSQGIKQEFPTLDQVVNLPTSKKSSTPSADIKSVQFNKDALVTLIYRDKQFQVSSIIYMPTLPQVYPNLPFGKKP